MQTIRFLILLAFLTSCSSSNEKPPAVEVTSFTGTAMTIPYRILIGEPVPEKRKEPLQDLIDMTFSEVNAVYNKYNPKSELSRLNRAEAYVLEPISVELSSILKEAANMVALSEGRFDPTVEPAQQLWKEHFSVGSKPTEEAISSVSNSIGWNKVHLNDDHFWKEHNDTSLDLGGIAKGLCVDMLTERLVNAGFDNVFVEWGGEIRAHGNHPEGRPWTVYISRLEDTNPDNAFAFVALNNQAIATSGDYLQRWTVGGTVYSHIFDPTSCRPLVVAPDSIASVTVLAPTCTMADALATAAMLFTRAEDAKKWAEEVKNNYPDVSFWIITRQEQAAN